MKIVYNPNDARIHASYKLGSITSTKHFNVDVWSRDQKVTNLYMQLEQIGFVFKRTVPEGEQGVFWHHIYI